MKSQIIISNPESFEKKKQIFKEGSVKNFHAVSDFDRTLTYGLDSQGKKTQTVISRLRSDPKYLGDNYQKEAHRLFDIYHPIEVDSKITLKEKKQKMHEWWKLHFDLIARSGLTKNLIRQVVQEKPIDFRDSSKKFFHWLNENNIPLIIMSAAPGDMLREYLKENKILHKSVFIFSNLFEFNSEGRATKIKEPIIHTFNKTEVSLKNSPVYEKIKDRKNVLLLGDSLGDVGMVEGFDYNEVIRMGFLNENVEENLEEYKKYFDVVLTCDQDFSFVNSLIEELFDTNKF